MTSSNSTLLKRTQISDPDFHLLIKELDDELRGLYGKDQDNFTPLNQLDESFHVLLLYHEREPIGCGAFRPIEDHGSVEIKRMYVRRAWRNHGKGRLIVLSLEAWAREEGYRRAVLETGIHQPEAIASYKRAGYHEIANYGPYENNPLSVCMAKDL